MAKTAKTAETNEFAAFDASAMTDQMRAFAEKGVEQSKEVYAKFKDGAEEAQKAIESTLGTVKAAGSDLSLKSIAALRANTEAGFAHLEALVGATSFSQVIELQTAFLRQQAEAVAAQAKELQAVASTAAETVAKPVKDAVAKVMDGLKAA